MTTRAVHVVIVAYHAADELERCLAALGRQGEVTVIDNSSSAEVQSVALRHGAAYADPGSNLGFGAGVNLALRQIMVGLPRDVLLLNPDAVLAPRDVQALVDFLHRPGGERIAALSPRLVGNDGAYQRVEWPFPTPHGAWVEAVGLGHRLQGRRTFVIPVRKMARRPASAGRPGSRRRLQGSRTFVIHVPKMARRPASAGRPGSRRRLQDSRTFVIPVPKMARRPASAGRPGSRRRRQDSRTFVIGAVLLLRWEALLEVGLFDERFFLYAEETDWQRRAASLGWTSAVCTEVLARHQGAGTSPDPRRREMLFHAAQETYIRKWHGRAGWLAYRAAALVGAAARAGLLSGDRRAEASRRALLYLRGPRRCVRLVRE